MVIDDVHGYSGGGNVKNWDGAYKGIMTIKTGLAASRNTTALQTFQAIPNKKINEFVTGLNHILNMMSTIIFMRLIVLEHIPGKVHLI